MVPFCLLLLLLNKADPGAETCTFHAAPDVSSGVCRHTTCCTRAGVETGLGPRWEACVRRMAHCFVRVSDCYMFLSSAPSGKKLSSQVFQQLASVFGSGNQQKAHSYDTNLNRRQKRQDSSTLT